MKIALLSNVTLDVLAGLLRKEHRVWMPSGFGAWIQTALEPPADLVDFGPDAIYLLLDGAYGSRNDALMGQATASLRSRFPGVPLVVPDLGRIAADLGGDFHDARMWRLASMPWSLKGLRTLRNLVGVKKVLALDLDNTLWDGVLGEEGVEGIRPRWDFIRSVKALQERGVLLTVLSKNDAADVARVFESGPLSRGRGAPLSRDDFVAWGVNWESKPENLERLARELNVGTESFVFVDDNPAERANMRARRPEVAVTEFPPDLEVYFPRYELTAEDRAKTAYYQAEAARRKWAEGLTVEDYLRGLEIWTDVHPLRSDEIPRVAQLSQKTNQFNVCVHRYSEDDVRAFAADPGRLIVTVHAGDRFGDQGLVAFVHVRGARIVDWVMSCRVMNRRIEFAAQTAVEDLLRARGVRRIVARWRRTEKNEPVRGLYEQLGFRVTSSTEDEKNYERILG